MVHYFESVESGIINLPTSISCFEYHIISLSVFTSSSLLAISFFFSKPSPSNANKNGVLDEKKGEDIESISDQKDIIELTNQLRYLFLVQRRWLPIEVCPYGFATQVLLLNQAISIQILQCLFNINKDSSTNITCYKHNLWNRMNSFPSSQQASFFLSKKT